MSDEDVRDLLIVIRGIRRDMEWNYHSFQHSRHQRKEIAAFERLLSRYRIPVFTAYPVAYEDEDDSGVVPPDQAGRR